MLTFEQVDVYNCSGAGFFFGGFDTLRLINCDSYNNCDSLSVDPGNHADGFWIMDGGGDGYYYRYTYVDGCRAWYNSDDGFDFSSSKKIWCHDNWSWGNGKLEYGDGTGYKKSI